VLNIEPIRHKVTFYFDFISTIAIVAACCFPIGDAGDQLIMLRINAHAEFVRAGPMIELHERTE